MSTEYLYSRYYKVINFIQTSKVIDLLDSECSAADGDESKIASTSSSKSKYYMGLGKLSSLVNHTVFFLRNTHAHVWAGK